MFKLDKTKIWQVYVKYINIFINRFFKTATQIKANVTTALKTYNMEFQR